LNKHRWPAPGSPKLAERIKGLLDAAGVDSELDQKRNYDHGVFVPLLLTFPNADIPVVQVSLHRSLDPALHIKMGKALAPLRDEGVFIIGSGFATHDMSRRLTESQGKDFTRSLVKAMESAPAEREQSLKDWKKLPNAKLAHPREEHLMPLHVVAGAAGDDKGVTIFDRMFGPWAFASFKFGQ